MAEQTQISWIGTTAGDSKHVAADCDSCGKECTTVAFWARVGLSPDGIPTRDSLVVCGKSCAQQVHDNIHTRLSRN